MTDEWCGSGGLARPTGKGLSCMRMSRLSIYQVRYQIAKGATDEGRAGENGEKGG